MHKFFRVLMCMFVAMVMCAGVAGTADAAPRKRRAVAASSYCRDGRVTNIGGLYFTGMKVRQDCRQIYGNRNMTSGLADLWNKTIIINHARNTSRRDMDKTRLHEMAHMVEWRTDNKSRARMYRHLGIRTNGNYFTIQNDNYYYNSKTFTIAKWRKAPRERLAESVVYCVYGTPNTYGPIKLVKKRQCKAFMNDFKKARNSAVKRTK